MIVQIEVMVSQEFINYFGEIGLFGNFEKIVAVRPNIDVDFELQFLDSGDLPLCQHA